ncbi:MAG: DoxX family protein [Acidobacteriota bacterium]|nr:DoxX family protein [Acidobacteriota bacterium]
MASLDSFYAAWTPRLISVLRIITGFLFIWHGSQKLFNYPALANGAVEPMSFMGFAGILEFAGGLLILIGLFTRPAAFILSGMMAVAYFMAHAPGGFLPLVNKGELAVLYSFVFLFLAVAGGGAWSLDNLLSWSKNYGYKQAEISVN